MAIIYIDASPYHLNDQSFSDAIADAAAGQATYLIIDGDHKHVTGSSLNTFVANIGNTVGILYIDGQKREVLTTSLVSLVTLTNTVAPVVSGLGVVGETLSTTNGEWTPTPDSYAYQWESDGTPIGGATSNTFEITVSEAGTSVTCVVTATNAAGSVDATSNGISVEGAPVNTVAPAVTGTPLIGETLTTTNGTWDNNPDSYSYQWQSDGVNIFAAIQSTYVLTNSEANTDVRCVVTATNEAGSTAANSNAVEAKAWTPEQLTLVAWYDPSDSANYTESGGLVSQLDDLTVNAYHLTQGTGANQPSVTGTTINGHTALSWESTLTGSISKTGITGESLTEISTAGIYMIPAGGGTNFDYSFSIEHSNDAANIRIQSGGSSRDMRLNSSAGLTEEIDAFGSVPYIATSKCPSAASVTFRFNGRAATTVYTENTITDLTEIHLGHDSSDDSNNWKGLVGEYIIATGVSESDLQKLEAYLALKWSAA